MPIFQLLFLIFLLVERPAFGEVTGDFVEPSSIPFGVCTVVLFDQERNVAGICTATLIGHSRIVTAAHCKRPNTASQVSIF